MSDHPFSDPVSTTEDLQVGFRAPKPASSGSRRSIASIAAVAVTATTLGAGVWAWHAFAGQGAQPSEALPADTLAYVALDLNPPGGQKVEAFTTLRKFPSIKRELGLDSVDDVRKSVVDQIGSDSGCDLSYARVEPWIGDRIAFAVVPQDHPQPVLVVQVDDADRARTALGSISADCGDGGFGYTVSDQWAVLAESTSIARQVQTDAGHGSLADAADFKRLTGAAGDPGLATLYAAPAAGKALVDAADDDPFAAIPIVESITSALDPLVSATSSFGLFYATTTIAESDYSESDSGSAAYEPKIPPKYQARWDAIQKRMEHLDELTQTQRDQLFREQEQLFNEMGPEVFGGPGVTDDAEAMSDDVSAPDDYPTPSLPAALRSSLQRFTGFGGVARFNDGTFEISLVGDTLRGTSQDLYAGNTAANAVADLPDDTAIAFGAGLSDDWVDAFVEQLQHVFSFTERSRAETITSFKKATGLDLPGDLEAIGADQVSVVVGGGFSPGDFFEHPERAPVAVRISGDRTEIAAALDKIRRRAGAGATPLVSRRLGEDVVVGTNASYLDHLARGGDLTGSEDFHRVVPDADGATTVSFVNFDAGDWLAEAVASDGGRKDAEPLGAAGMSLTRDGDQQRIRYRVSFD